MKLERNKLHVPRSTVLICAPLQVLVSADVAAAEASMLNLL